MWDETDEAEEEWVELPGSKGQDFYNATHHRRLVELGYVPENPVGSIKEDSNGN